jgi:hypothetical protein
MMIKASIALVAVSCYFVVKTGLVLINEYLFNAHSKAAI